MNLDDAFKYVGQVLQERHGMEQKGDSLAASLAFLEERIDLPITSGALQAILKSTSFKIRTKSHPVGAVVTAVKEMLREWPPSLLSVFDAKVCIGL
jgi:hypothetical protein